MRVIRVVWIQLHVQPSRSNTTLLEHRLLLPLQQLLLWLHQHHHYNHQCHTLLLLLIGVPRRTRKIIHMQLFRQVAYYIRLIQ